MSAQPPYGQPPQGPYPPQGQYPAPYGQYPAPYGPPPRRGPGTGALVAILTAVVLVVAGGVVATVLLVGGDEDESADDESTSQTEDDPAGEPEPSGASVTGSGFSFTLPSGWTDVSQEASSTDADAVAAAAAGSSLEGTPANVLVTTASAGGATVPGELRSAWESQIAADAGVTPTPIPAPDVGGLETSAIQLERVNSSGTPIVQVGYLIISDGQQYNIMCTTTKSAEAESRAAFDEILGGWTWQ